MAAPCHPFVTEFQAPDSDRAQSQLLETSGGVNQGMDGSCALSATQVKATTQALVFVSASHR